VRGKLLARGLQGEVSVSCTVGVFTQQAICEVHPEELGVPSAAAVDADIAAGE
jgi:hypothetical protein